jgi:hypothetical protein
LSTLTNISRANVATTTETERATASPGTARVTAKSAQPGIRNRTVLLYLVLAVLVLVPGLALRAGLDAATLDPTSLRALGLGRLSGNLGELASYLKTLQQELQDIQFGNGLRFWLGVGGTTMLGLLSLYPVRKVLANRSGVGSVGGWFHLHILLGIAGPVLILYHSNFGHSSLNANVALWTMLLVAVSGIIGFFVYGRVSANFYNSRQHAQTHRNAVLAGVPDSALFQTRKDLLIAKFEAFEAELLTPRQGFTASIRARLRLERRRREIANDVVGLVIETARSRGDTPAAYQQFRGLASRHVRAYFGIARAAASQSIMEQLWSRWRLLHMPAFLIMIVATILHVIAVWDRSEPTMAETDQARVEVAGTRTASLPTTKPVAAAVSAETTIAKAQDQVEPRPTTPSGLSQRIVKPIMTPRTADASTKPASAEAPVVAPVPKLVRRPVKVEPAQIVAAADVSTSAVRTAEPTRAEPKPAPAIEPRRLEPPTMALGGNPGAFKASSLDETFAAFKAKQQAGEFSHSEGETGFALMGKHLKTECASCHNAPLPVSRQNTAARSCLSCHEKDDNHSGRRPDCARCHTTNRWKQRIR